MTQRPSSAARGYNHRWRRFRATVLKQEPLCRACASVGRVRAATVVDHISPHRGDPKLFWASDNLQPLCKSCHDAAKQAAERAGYAAILDEDGWPADPRHPANAWEGGRKSQSERPPRPGGQSKIELVRPGAGPA